MLKKTIQYEDYNGQTRTEDFYFHLTKAELVELELSEKGGFGEALQQIVRSEDGKLIVEHFKKIILLAYGQKSEDGRRFIKTQELRDEFAQTEAYSSLFVELATDAGAAAAFINGIVPADLDPGQVEAAAQNVELQTAPPVLESEATNEIKEPTDEELLAMDPQKMTQDQLLRAFKLRSQQ